MSQYDADMRARLKAQCDAETDPTAREAYALAARAGCDWFDTESNARYLAGQAAGEILALRAERDELLLSLKMLTSQAVDTCGVISEYIAMPTRSLSDKFPTTVFRLKSRIEVARRAIAKTKGAA